MKKIINIGAKTSFLLGVSASVILVACGSGGLSSSSSGISVGGNVYDDAFMTNASVLCYDPSVGESLSVTATVTDDLGSFTCLDVTWTGVVAIKAWGDYASYDAVADLTSTAYLTESSAVIGTVNLPAGTEEITDASADIEGTEIAKVAVSRLAAGETIATVLRDQTILYYQMMTGTLDEPPAEVLALGIGRYNLNAGSKTGESTVLAAARRSMRNGRATIAQTLNAARKAGTYETALSDLAVAAASAATSNYRFVSTASISNLITRTAVPALTQTRMNSAAITGEAVYTPIASETALLTTPTDATLQAIATELVVAAVTLSGYTDVQIQGSATLSGDDTGAIGTITVVQAATNNLTPTVALTGTATGGSFTLSSSSLTLAGQGGGLTTSSDVTYTFTPTSGYSTSTLGLTAVSSISGYDDTTATFTIRYDNSSALAYPTSVQQSTVEITSGDNKSITITATDDDGDTLTYYVSGNALTLSSGTDGYFSPSTGVEFSSTTGIAGLIGNADVAASGFTFSSATAATTDDHGHWSISNNIITFEPAYSATMTSALGYAVIDARGWGKLNEVLIYNHR